MTEKESIHQVVVQRVTTLEGPAKSFCYIKLVTKMTCSNAPHKPLIGYNLPYGHVGPSLKVGLRRDESPASFFDSFYQSYLNPNKCMTLNQTSERLWTESTTGLCFNCFVQGDLGLQPWQ